MTWSNLRFNVWRSFIRMATNLPSCFVIQCLEQLLKFLLNFTLLKYVKSKRSYGFLITKELIFGFQILDLKDHFSASLTPIICWLSFSSYCWEIFCFVYFANDSMMITDGTTDTDNDQLNFWIKAFLGMLARLPWGRRDVLGSMDGGKHGGVYVEYVSLMVSCYWIKALITAW